MGQKSNPNSFQILTKTTNHISSSHQSLEYSNLLKEQFSISSNLITFFEKNNCLVKDCFFTLNNEKAFITVFINFFILKKRKRTRKKSTYVPKAKSEVSLIVQKIFKILTRFGYFSSKRIVFQNLNKLALNSKKFFLYSESTRIQKELRLFNKEIYFEPGILLFYLLNTTKKNGVLIGKFIARFFRMLHRTKKINKFLLFLSKFVANTNNIRFKNSTIKGLKIQIKGRTNGIPRPRKHIFEKGRIPLQTISCSVNYSLTHINTSYGVFGLKIWIFD